MKKQIISIAFVMAMVLALVPLTALAADVAPTKTTFMERYTFDESKDTLYYGNAAKDNVGEIAFVKEN